MILWPLKSHFNFFPIKVLPELSRNQNGGRQPSLILWFTLTLLFIHRFFFKGEGHTNFVGKTFFDYIGQYRPFATFSQISLDGGRFLTFWGYPQSRVPLKMIFFISYFSILSSISMERSESQLFKTIFKIKIGGFLAEL